MSVLQKNTIVDNNPKDKKRLKPNPKIPDEKYLITLAEGWEEAKKVLEMFGFQLSPTQPNTPGNG